MLHNQTTSRLVVIFQTSRGTGAAEEPRAAHLRDSFFPSCNQHIMDGDKTRQILPARAPKGPGTVSPQTILLCSAAGFGRRVLAAGAEPLC